MKKNYLILSFLFLIGQAALALPMSDDCNVDVIFKNVGQGNCTILRSRVPGRTRTQPDRYEICIFDIGTGQRPAVAQHPAFNPNMQVPEPLNVANRRKVHTLEEDIRGDLGDALSITVTLSHPDLDHYNLLKYISGTNRIRRQPLPIRHLIIGGNPFDYDQSFREAARYLFNQGTRIYFPCVDVWHNNANHNIAELNQTFGINLDRVCDDDNVAGDNVAIIPSRYADPNNPNNYIVQDGDNDPINLFNASFQFTSDALRVACLGVNPIHFTKNNRTFRMHNLDDNADSLVFKIIYGDSSVMIPGDASIDTTEAITGNYNTNLNFLRASVCLASHHGSLERGGNHPCFLGHVQPTSIIVSHGDRYHHPRHIAINRLNFHDTLAQVAPHYFYYNTRQGNAINCFYTSIDRKIFSTMGGDITVELHQNGNTTLDQGGEKY